MLILSNFMMYTIIDYCACTLSNLTNSRSFTNELQNIIMYEYLPNLLGQDLSPYAGYKPDVHPGISHVFQSAAFR